MCCGKLANAVSKVVRREVLMQKIQPVVAVPVPVMEETAEQEEQREPTWFQKKLLQQQKKVG